MVWLKLWGAYGKDVAGNQRYAMVEDTEGDLADGEKGGYERGARTHWTVHRHKDRRGRLCYDGVRRCIKRPNGEWATEHLARLVLDRKLMDTEGRHLPYDTQAHHPNHRPFDCRRANLEAVDSARNKQMKLFPKNNTSGFKGVYRYKGKKKWVVRVGWNGGNDYVGSFEDIEVAARMYDWCMLQLHGQYFAPYLNFPRSDYPECDRY